MSGKLAACWFIDVFTFQSCLHIFHIVSIAYTLAPHHHTHTHTQALIYNSYIVLFYSAKLSCVIPQSIQEVYSDFLIRAHDSPLNLYLCSILLCLCTPLERCSRMLSGESEWCCPVRRWASLGILGLIRTPLFR